MNVLVITPWYPSPAHPFEGIYIKLQVEAFVKAGLDVTVVSPRPHWLPVPGKNRDYWRRNASLPLHLAIDGVDIYFPRYWAFPGGLRWSSIGAASYAGMRRLLTTLNEQRDFEIIHGHEIEPAGLSAWWIKRQLGLPFILTIHGANSSIAARFASRRAEPLRRQMWAAVDCVAAVGRPLLSYLQGIGCARERITVIPNGVVLDQEALESTHPIIQFEQHRVIVSVSNLLKSKGIDLNLEALRQLTNEGLTDWHYAIIGDGPERRRLERLTAHLGLERHVTLLGSLSRRETMSHLSRCDVFSLPSWQEAFGIVYLEAMAHGKPVIGCEGQGAEDIIRHEVDGLLVKPRDVNSLALALKRLLLQRDWAQALGSNGRERAREFSWEHNASMYTDLFEMARSSPARPGTRIRGSDGTSWNNLHSSI